MPVKPTLGYPSRTAAVLAFRRLRLSTDQIADLIGISPKNVVALECSSIRSRTRAKRPSEEHGRTIVFPVDILDALSPHAAKRGIHVNQLVRRIVETVSDEGMVDAVLDDLLELSNAG